MKISDIKFLFRKGEKRGSIGGAIVSLIFIAIGVFLIYWAFQRPCDVEPITQVVNGQTAVVDQPEQMDRLICLSSDYVSLISVLIGAAMIFPGVGGLFRNLLEKSTYTGKKGKKKKK